MSAGTPPELQSIAELLERRIAIIADHAFRDRDPKRHLDALRTVSEDIAAAHRGLAGQLPVRLEHFLSNCSYDKALAFIQEQGAAGS